MNDAYDVLEKRSADNEFCKAILHFMVTHPLKNYTKIRLLDIENALKELSEIAKELTDLAKQYEKEQDNNAFDSVLGIFMLHVSCIFSRNMVEILICLSFSVEPHIAFWENQYRLNGDQRRYKIYNHLSKIYTLPIAMRRARIFKKLLSDLYVQIGHIQWWFWALVKLKNENNENGMTNVSQFIGEMDELLKASNNDNESDNNNVQKDKNMIDSFVETVSFSDSFVIKMQEDIKKWGMPSHWRQNYKVYSFWSVSILFSSMFSYYHWTQISEIGNNSVYILKNLFMEHFYDPIREILAEVFYFDNSKKTEYQKTFEMEKDVLSDMIKSFEIKHLNQSNVNAVNERAKSLNMSKIMDRYKKDIESPISSATKGSLLQNIFVQIQKMKVETSKLMIDVDDILDGNKINTEILATIPFVGLLYILQQLWSNSNGTNKIKKKSIKEMRTIFRSVYSILIRNYNEQNVGFEDCGLMLFLMYKLMRINEKSLHQQFKSREEYEWMKFDINHFISREFSVQQRLTLLERMEKYYL